MRRENLNSTSLQLQSCRLDSLRSCQIMSASRRRIQISIPCQELTDLCQRSTTIQNCNARHSCLALLTASAATLRHSIEVHRDSDKWNELTIVLLLCIHTTFVKFERLKCLSVWTFFHATTRIRARDQRMSFAEASIGRVFAPSLHSLAPSCPLCSSTL